MRTESSLATSDRGEAPEVGIHGWLTPAFMAAIGILLLHGILIAISIPDYRVTIDSAYHVSLGRAYGEHGLVPWDHINFGPRGRPNLQGPLLHAAIGFFGRAIGGRGGDYVLANAILAVVQWTAAMGTAAFFAYELGGDLTMLFTASVLSGAAFASGSFAAGIPSGWLFVFTPWAIWFFVRGRTGASAIATSAGIYSHLGGYLTAPSGVFVAAALTNQWRALATVGLLTAILTAPYTTHVVRYCGWLSGVQSHSALLFDPMLDALATAGAVRLLRRPRRNAFMAAWLIAPLAWLFQDPGRFFLQWPLGGSVAAGLLLADRLRNVASDQRRGIYAVAIVAIATLAPFGPPSIASEIAWDAGMRWPRPVDWNHARALAGAIRRAGLAHDLVADYSPALCPAIAVYADISCEKGHWVEVQPRNDPADELPAAGKVYVLPMPPDDSALAAMRARGWVQTHGGADDTAVVTLGARPPMDEAARVAANIIAAESQWLARNAVNNSLGYADWRRALSPSAMAEYRGRLSIERIHAGNLQLACIVYAWALEPSDPADARAMRRVARGFGVIASFLGDDLALDFISDQRFAQLREALIELAASSNRLALYPSPAPEMMQTFDSVIGTVLETRGRTFAERPAGDRLPWLR